MQEVDAHAAPALNGHQGKGGKGKGKGAKGGKGKAANDAAAGASSVSSGVKLEDVRALTPVLCDAMAVAFHQPDIEHCCADPDHLQKPGGAPGRELGSEEGGASGAGW
jgi:hypothetical protein